MISCLTEANLRWNYKTNEKLDGNMFWQKFMEQLDLFPPFPPIGHTIGHEHWL